MHWQDLDFGCQILKNIVQDWKCRTLMNWKVRCPSYLLTVNNEVHFCYMLSWIGKKARLGWFCSETLRVYIFKWYNLLITEFDHLEVTLSGWQDIKIQLLTDYSLSLSHTHTHTHTHTCTLCEHTVTCTHTHTHTHTQTHTHTHWHWFAGKHTTICRSQDIKLDPNQRFQPSSSVIFIYQDWIFNQPCNYYTWTKLLHVHYFQWIRWLVKYNDNRSMFCNAHYDLS